MDRARERRTAAVNGRNETGDALRVVKLAVSVFWVVVERIRRRGATAVVLYYHDVPAEQRPAFGRQLDLLQRSMQIVDPLELSSARSGAHVAVTFDDGLVSFADNAVPELAARGIPSAVFVPSGFLSRPPTWVTDGRFDLEVERVMDEDRIRSLPDLVRVGSHTASHPDLTGLTSDEQARELRESRETLEAIVGRPVTVLSFPFGSYSDAVVDTCRQAGDDRFYTTEPRPVSLGSRDFVVDRVAADPSDWNLELRIKALGGYAWLAHYGRLRRRLRARRRGTKRLMMGQVF
jgi:peptidoglycan/xylan/chitin deacetylase (PgdA/CDA1 family)